MSSEFKQAIAVNSNLSRSHLTVKGKKEMKEIANYGSYRDTYDPVEDKLTLVNFICKPTDRELEYMIIHANEQHKKNNAKRKKNLRKLETKDDNRTKVSFNS